MRRAIAEAAPSELAWYRELRRANQYQLGFIPWTRVDELAARGGVVYASEGGLEAGFVVHEALTRRPRVWKLQQACVDFDVRRLAHGLALVEHVCATARLHGRAYVECVCRCDLPALVFWREAGFEAVAWVQGGRRYGLPCIVLRRAVVAGVHLRADPPKGPRSKKAWGWISTAEAGGLVVPA